MELYGRSTSGGSPADQPVEMEWTPGVETETGIEESMRQLGLLGGSGSYPQRSGTADCTYYTRTGSCGYGSKCRYNHPRDRGSSSIAGAVKIGGGEYPERAGEPICQYYLRTGTCKFGASCKFHHPRHAGGSLINVPLNIHGYPLRPGEEECSHFLKTGQCKFGISCKFHHPQSTGSSAPAAARPFYPTVQPPPAPSPEQYGGPLASYRVARPPLIPGSYIPNAYGPVILPPGMVPIQNWSTYSGPVSPALSPGAQHSIGAASRYGMTSSPPTFAGPYTPLPPSTGPSSSRQTERVFPERPGQFECQYYMKTGDCKFGPNCKYHHPPDWAISKANCVLSSIGLPLRPGVQPCNFYLQNGKCKYGPTCKFDHPITTVRYSPSASSLTDIPIAPYVLGPSLSSLAPSTSFPEWRPEFISRSKMNPNLPILPSSSSPVGLIFTQMGSSVPYPYSDGHISYQSSSSLSISRSTRQGGKVHHTN